MKVPFVYGIFTGIIYILYFFLDYLLGYQTEKFDIGVLTSITIFVVPMIMTYLGTKAHLNRLEKPAFTQGIIAAGTIVLVGGLIATLYSKWHIGHFTPDYVEMAKAFIQARGEETGASPAEIQQFLQKTEARFSQPRRLLTCMLGFVVTGIPAGVVATWLFLKRNR